MHTNHKCPRSDERLKDKSSSREKKPTSTKLDFQRKQKAGNDCLPVNGGNVRVLEDLGSERLTTMDAISTGDELERDYAKKQLDVRTEKCPTEELVLEDFNENDNLNLPTLKKLVKTENIAKIEVCDEIRSAKKMNSPKKRCFTWLQRFQMQFQALLKFFSRNKITPTVF